MVETKGKKLLFDPFISPNDKAKDAVDVQSLKPDYVLLSHGHEDHVADAMDIIKNSGATLISNFEVVTYYQNQGVENAHPMNHGGNWHFDFGRVKYTTGIHSSMLPDGSNGGNPGGFVVENDEGTFYFAGDTALTYDMKLIGEEFNLDFALLPVGDNFTMGVDDALKAAEFIQCDKIIGLHFDTFGFIEIDHDAAKKKFKAAGKELTLLQPGEEKNF